MFKDYFLFLLLILIFLSVSSCSKKKSVEPSPNQDNKTTINQTHNYAFTVGNYDSATYYLFQPSLDLTYLTNFPGYYEDIDSFDIDLNNTLDIALRIYGYADMSIVNNFTQIELYNLNNYEFVCDTSNNVPDTMNIGDTLNNSLNWINQNIFLLRYTSPQNDYGNWHHLGYNQKFIGFRSITNDTIMGWFRLGSPYPHENGVALRITDCAIEKINPSSK